MLAAQDEDRTYMTNGSEIGDFGGPISLSLSLSLSLALGASSRKRCQTRPLRSRARAPRGSLQSGGREGAWGPGVFDHARAQESVDARRECPTTSALTHFRERSRDSLLIADFCSCSSGSMHVLNTILFGVEVGIWVCGEYALDVHQATKHPSRGG